MRKANEAQTALKDSERNAIGARDHAKLAQVNRYLCVYFFSSLEYL